jgi:hypothetical protein
MDLLSHFRQRKRLKVFCGEYVDPREELMLEWKKLHNGKLHNLSSFVTVSVIKLKKLRCVGHIACMGQMRNCAQFWV